MNKAEFLAGLRDALAGKLPSGELEDVLSYYEEYFADAGEEHEAEAAEGLGSPASVAAQVLEGRTGQAPSAASAERRPRRLWPVVLGICAAALLLLGVGIRLVFLAQRMPDAPAAGERQPVAAGQEPVVVEQDPVSTPPENKLELEPFTALDIDVGIGDIRMEEGDGWYLSLTSGGQDGDGTPYRLNHSQSGDTLEIWSTPENISGDGSPKGEVVLTVPEGTVLNRAEISIGVGALDWSGCAVEGLLRAESGVGGLGVTAPVGEAEQISGVGGQVDFVRGASASKGGVSIMAMPSTVKGKISKIVPLLDEGAAVTTSRNDVDYIVTEYGVAALKGQTLRQRARNLIEIAHPDFRDELKAEYEKRFHCKY